MAIHVTVWNEYLHEKQFPEIASIYPKGIHGCIADFLQKAGMTVQTATLEEPEHGLTQDVLDNTDVLIWWGHMAHHKVADEIVERVYRRVLDGIENLPEGLRHELGQAEVARGRRAGNPLGHRPEPPDRRGAGREDYDPARGDVRRALRYPATGRAGIHQLVRGRRGVPQRLLLAPR